MAQPIDYAPPPGLPGQDLFTAEDDLARTLQALHESGTLRILAGLLGRFEEVMAVFLEHIDTPKGHNLNGNLVILGKLLANVDADGLDRFVTALTDGLDNAGKKLSDPDDPPGFLGLTKRLHEPDVRRGLDALITLLGSLGAGLATPADG